jgi:uncharacterized protein YlzI (FlbEa/FlbD family)
MKLIKLTSPNGAHRYVVPGSIEDIAVDLSGTSNSAVTLGSATIIRVKETVDEIVKMLESIKEE